MCIAILQHAILGFLQCIEAITHFWPSLPTSMGDASIVKHEAEARIQSCECTSVLSESRISFKCGRQSVGAKEHRWLVVIVARFRVSC
jgi:hypothetical protein